jgi:hypothetical protein
LRLQSSDTSTNAQVIIRRKLKSIPSDEPVVICPAIGSSSAFCFFSLRPSPTAVVVFLQCIARVGAFFFFAARRGTD